MTPWDRREIAAMRGLLRDALKQLEWAADEDRSDGDRLLRFGFMARECERVYRKARNAHVRAAGRGRYRAWPWLAKKESAR